MRPHGFAQTFEYSDAGSQGERPSHALPEQEIGATASRWSAPRAWRRALEQALVAALVKGATSVTPRIVADLADRMNFSTGHVAYDLEGIAARCGVSVATVKRHIGYLRRAGWLAWVEHGSLRNALKRLGDSVRGYARTATVYAATIPASYDQAAGNEVIGFGYDARLRTPGPGLTPVDIPVENPAPNTKSGSCEPPSLRLVQESGSVSDGGGFTTTPRAGRAKNRAARKSILGQTVTAAAFQTATRIARTVRPLVNWLQQATIGQLSWAMVDLVLQGQDEHDILSWCYQVGRTQADGSVWRPDRPHRYLAAQLLTQAAQDQKRANVLEEQVLLVDRPGVHGAPPSAAFLAAVQPLEAFEDQDGPENPAGVWERAVASLRLTEAEARQALTERANGGWRTALA